MSKILVSGSIAYDRIMNFPGRFRDHILPEKIHVLSVSFLVNRLQESFGGTAGNIAYSLALLGHRPIVLGAVGQDFAKYQAWCRRQRIDISRVKKVASDFTASAYIITDQDDNQIAGFYGGPARANCTVAASHVTGVVGAIIGPDFKQRMLKYARIYQAKKISYIFDPGQETPQFTADELRRIMPQAKALIGNDYEIELIMKKLSWSLAKLRSAVPILVVTKGAKGSDIYYYKNNHAKIAAVKLKRVVDPTGAGDAYRAGLMHGLLQNWDVPKAARLGSLVAAYAVEAQGTQTHRFTWAQLKQRYRKNFGESL